MHHAMFGEGAFFFNFVSKRVDVRNSEFDLIDPNLFKELLPSDPLIHQMEVT